VRGGPEHVGEVEERDGAELLISLLEHLPRVVGEPPVAVHVRGVHPPNLLDQPRLVGDVIEGHAVAPLKPVERSHRQQADIVGHSPAGEREQLLQAVRGGDHGRPGIEDVAAILVDGGPATGLIVGLVADRLEAHRLQADGRGEAAKAAADHRRPPARACAWPRRTQPCDGRQAHGRASAFVG
jgi:hypothetical protein